MCWRAGRVLDGPLKFIVAEVNWQAMDEKNSGTRLDIAHRYIGALDAAGFDLREDSLHGPLLGLHGTELLEFIANQTAPDLSVFMSRAPGAFPGGPV